MDFASWISTSSIIEALRSGNNVDLDHLVFIRVDLSFCEVRCFVTEGT